MTTGNSKTYALIDEAIELVRRVNDLLLDANGQTDTESIVMDDLRDSRDDLRSAAKLVTKAMSRVRRTQEGKATK